MFQSAPGLDWPGDNAAPRPRRRSDAEFQSAPGLDWPGDRTVEIEIAQPLFQSAPGLDWPGDPNFVLRMSHTPLFQSAPGLDWPGDMAETRA